MGINIAAIDFEALADGLTCRSGIAEMRFRERQLSNFRVADLKFIIRYLRDKHNAYQLRLNGRKQELIDRILDAMEQPAPSNSVSPPLQPSSSPPHPPTPPPPPHQPILPPTYQRSPARSPRFECQGILACIRIDPNLCGSMRFDLVRWVLRNVKGGECPMGVHLRLFSNQHLPWDSEWRLAINGCTIPLNHFKKKQNKVCVCVCVCVRHCKLIHHPLFFLDAAGG